MLDATNTIGSGWRSPEIVAARSASLDVPATAIFMQMSEQMTTAAKGGAFLIVERTAR
jgi:hypothetical protein